MSESVQIGMSTSNEHEKFDHDAIICGSGAAGCVMAVELAKAGMDVVVIEASDIDNGALEDIADRISVHGKRSPLYNFARQLGGSTNLWSGRTSFFDPIDFELNDWPLSFSELADDVNKARCIIGAPEPELDTHLSSAFMGAWSALIESPFSLKHFVMQNRIKPFNAYSYLKNQRLKNIKILKDKVACKILHDNNDNAVGIEIYDRVTDSIKTLEANIYILANGGLDVPRLLLESNLPEQTNRCPIGRYLSTHPKLYIGTLKVRGRRRANNALLSDLLLENQYVRLGLGLDSETLKTDKLLNHYLQISPAFESRSEEFLESVAKDNRVISYLYGLGGMFRSIIQFCGRLYFQLSQRLAGRLGYYSTFNLKLHCDQNPNPDCQVSLSDKYTCNKTRKINIDWSFSEDDYRNARDFLIMFKIYIEKYNVGEVELEDFIYDSTWPMVGMHSHFMGTSRMGNNIETSVTDSFGKLHGFKNIYIVGPSVFTGYGFTNPVLPIAAFAVRTANRIISKWKGMIAN